MTKYGLTPEYSDGGNRRWPVAVETGYTDCGKKEWLVAADALYIDDGAL